ncbi:queuosine precursor transporter [Legionella impletisoli]|uniref:Queuosine precursor transporter n=1 Tax=Legionella impletisoli TaxID=343510 RepID=A0A917NAD0_9GAMM|nr:queuosine precursor transporter [Legionella impletisoli]GGI82686.1 transporter [Legionella impletisoli]
MSISIQRQAFIENLMGYRVLIILCMFYMSIMLCNAVLTNRYVGTDLLFVLGGTLTSPFVFILDDIIAEIYGFKITRAVIIVGFLAQTLFVIVCQLILWAPSPSFFKGQEAYAHVLGSSLLRINLCGFIAYIIANLANSYLLSRWKVLVKGRYFWLRSLGSSTISEALYSFIAIIMMELASIPLKNILQVAAISFSIKAIYSIVFAGPANVLVNYLKNLTGIDVYDFPEKFTPFKYLNETSEPLA